MCGIFGYFDRDRTASLTEAALLDMGTMIAHRGPDDRGVFAGPGVGLGNQRLSIIDLDHGHQPFVSRDGQIVVVQNGEIFNYVELMAELQAEGVVFDTQSDTEVILRLYEAHGIAAMNRLNGMFAIAIYDARTDMAFLVRDRIGVKPLYLWEQGARLYFASEIKSFLLAGLQPKMDTRALSGFLTFNYVPPPLTFFEGVRHLMPGHTMTLTRSGHTEQQWWRLADAEPVAGKSEADWMAAFTDLLDDAVRLRLRSDAPFGAFLSGGVDSSTVVGLMARHMDRPVKTYAIGFDDPRFDESGFAATAAARFGTEHTCEIVDPDMLHLWPMAVYHCDQPHGDVSFMPTYRVAALASKDVKMVLTGDGGDELFAGYDKYRDFFAGPMAGAAQADFRAAYAANISLFDPATKQALLAGGIAAAGADDVAADMLAPLWDQSGHFDRLNQALYIDMSLLLPGNNLVKPDRMGMATSLEARTPFLDYRMMEFAFTMPGDLKLKDGETKYIFKKAVADLIGEDLAYRKKQMFTVPIGEWFRSTKKAYCENMLLSNRSTARGLFNRDVVADMFAAHVDGRENRTRELRALIAIEHWHRLFVDGEWRQMTGREAA